MLEFLCVARRVLLLGMAAGATACTLTSPAVIPSGNNWQLSGMARC
jgi:hypothetical protein